MRKAERMNLQVLFEDNHLIAINKPAGYLVQADQTGDVPLTEYVKDYIKARYGKPGEVFLGVVHRLDRPVSGVLLFARTSKGLERMNKLFHDREVTKLYWAITEQMPDPLVGELTHYLLKDHERNRAKVYEQLSKRTPDAKKSELKYRMLGRLGHNSLLAVEPITGRPHQIRAQLAHIGAPIRGDLKYGAGQANQDGNISLHCRSLSFIHPVRKELVTITADPPNEQSWQLFADITGV